MRFASMPDRRDRGATLSNARQHSTRLAVEALEDRTVPSTLFVTSLLDSGAGSLRAAVERANQLRGSDTIVFTRAGTINLITPLSLTDGSTIIDGTTAPGYAGAPVVVLHGRGAASGVNGLT